MSAVHLATLMKMVQALPDAAQGRVVEHVREYIEDMRDELKWDALFSRTQPQLAARAKKARQEMRKGKAKPLYDAML